MLTNHTKSFKDKKYANETELSKYIWDLKEKERVFTIKWEILERVATYTIGIIPCNLCLGEKLSILKADKRTLLNKKLELASKCRHQNKSNISKFNISKFNPVEKRSDESSSLPFTIAMPPITKRKVPPDTYSVA